jgi:magnesium-transporting ATPase (P-type)
MFAISINIYAITNTENNVEKENSTATSIIDIKEEQINEKDDFKEKYSSEKTGTIAYWLHKISIYSYLLSLVIWITCIISLILNCVRKNIGKAVFSGIGLIVPLISIFIYSLSKTMYAINENGMSICIFSLALILEVVVEILALVFCFSKNRSDKRI